MINKKFLFSSLIIFVLSLSLVSVAWGQNSPKGGLQQANTKLTTIGGAYGTNPLPLTVIVGGIIKTALSLLGVIFLILTIYGGYKWMIARGESKEVETAKDIITRAVIGLIIVLAAYAITYFVVVQLTVGAGISTVPSTPAQ